MMKQLDIALAELVTKVESLSPKLWQIAMRQVWVNMLSFVIMIIICGLILGFSIYFIIKLIKYIKSDKYKGYNEEFQYVGVALLSFVIVLTTILIFVSVYYIGAILINPEFEALKIILQLIK